MKTILQEIFTHKINLIEFIKSQVSKKELIKKIYNNDKTRGFLKKIQANIENNLINIIAEIKKSSPSKGIIKEDFNPSEIAMSYQNGNASCISVLTDKKYFMGTNSDLIKVKKITNLPILRKDFIVSDYQIYESRAIGADCILLISEILNQDTINNYISIAKDLDLDVIIEVHKQEDLAKYINLDHVLIGINNRNLKNMKVDINHSLDLVQNLNSKNNIICESGINSYDNFQKLTNNGFKNFLIGEYLMKSKNPTKVLLDLLNLEKSNSGY